MAGMTESRTAPRTRGSARRGLSPFTVVGVLLLAVGLGCLGFVAYQYLGTTVAAQRAYRDQGQEVREQWRQPAEVPADAGPADGPTAARPGDTVALLRIPRFGTEYEVPVVKGADEDTLTRGVGWYENTAAPGQVGNFAVAGHRVTHGEPFARLLELEAGDEVVVETGEAVFTYTVNKAPADLTVADDEVWPLEPVPGSPGRTPTDSIITLTTCQDLFRSTDRSVGFGVLTSTQPK